VTAARRILFVIRGKLGDSLVLYSAVRQYRAQFPGDDLTLAIRRDYAHLLRGETGLRLLPFGSRLEMLVRLVWLRLTAPPFDVLAVLWGFGAPIRLLGRMVRARRKIHIDGRFPEVLPEWPELPREHKLVAPALAVIHRFEPRLEEPRALEIGSLAAQRSPQAVVGVVPVADEIRRNLDYRTLAILLRAVRAKYPEHEIRVFLNPRNRGAENFSTRALPEGAILRRFSDLTDLLRQYRILDAWYGTDTGLYHLAVAMGVPATVFFGPTQPWKIVMPEQSAMTWVRSAVLGDAHCEVKDCQRPHCLHGAIAAYASASAPSQLADTPGNCPLRAAPSEAAMRIRKHENPRRQAR
jgi:hypothetical protein